MSRGWYIQRLAILLLATLATASQGAAPSCLKYLNNALSFADRQGHCAIWCEFDQKVETAGDVRLPIRFQFNSNPRYVADSCLGHGWWFPLLESTVVSADERTVLMHLPGGFVQNLIKDTKTPDTYHSPDLKYRGVQTENTFEVTSTDGWQFHFKEGRLSSAKTAGGDKLTWKYENNRVAAISSASAGELLRATYAPVSNLLESLAFNRGKDGMHFTYGSCPLITNALGQNAISRLVPTLARVRNKAGFDGTFAVSSSDDLSEMKMLMSYVSEDKSVHKQDYAWDSVSKLILRDYTGQYGIDVSDHAKGGHAKIVRTLPDGRMDGYKYDVTTGVWENLHPDGKVVRHTFVLTPGRAYGKPRRIETLQGQVPVDLRTFSYDDEGKQLRTVINGKETRFRYLKSPTPEGNKNQLIEAIRESIAGKCSMVVLRESGDKKLFEIQDAGVFLHPLFFGENSGRASMMHFPLASFTEGMMPFLVRSTSPSPGKFSAGGKTYSLVNGQITISTP